MEHGAREARTSDFGNCALSVCAAVALLAGCGAGTTSALPPSQSIPPPVSKIKHVVIIVQENRSFNDLFYGFPGAYTVSYGRDPQGRRIALQPIGLQTSGISITARAPSFPPATARARFRALIAA
jgi:phospholipase C